MTSDPAEGPSRPNLLVALGRLLRTLLGTLETRLEILGTEVEEEKLRLVALLALVLGAAFCLGTGLLLVVAFVVVALWQEYRLAALAGAAGAFLVAGAGLVVAIRSALRRAPKPFSATIEELRKDRRRLTGGP